MKNRLLLLTTIALIAFGLQAQVKRARSIRPEVLSNSTAVEEVGMAGKFPHAGKSTPWSVESLTNDSNGSQASQLKGSAEAMHALMDLERANTASLRMASGHAKLQTSAKSLSKTVTVTAGGLSSALTPTERYMVTNLTITGTIDARDFKTMRENMSALAFLVLSNVSIAEYTGTDGTVNAVSTTYPANAIPEYAFISKSGLVAITIPSSVNAIRHCAFKECTGLTSVTIPSSVTSIGNSAFGFCSGLTSITIPSLVTVIGENAFQYCSGLTSVTIPSSVTSIGDSAFEGCSGLTSVTIPSSVTAIGVGEFLGCNGLTSVIIPSSVTSIGRYAFTMCNSLTSITIPSSVTAIGDWAFSCCSGLTSVNISSSVTAIGYEVFSSCRSLTSVTIPSSVTSIGDYAFQYCSGLTSVIIPSSVTAIGDGAFSGCLSLTAITTAAITPVDLSSSVGVFYEVNTTTCILYVPIGSKSAYQAANLWKDFTHIVEFNFMLSASTVSIANEKVSIYPNPATDGFYVEGFGGKATLCLYDVNGKQLIQRLVIAKDYIPVKELTPGIYIISIRTEAGNTVNKRLMKY